MKTLGTEFHRKGPSAVVYSGGIRHPTMTAQISPKSVILTAFFKIPGWGMLPSPNPLSCGRGHPLPTPQPLWRFWRLDLGASTPNPLHWESLSMLLRESVRETIRSFKSCVTNVHLHDRKLSYIHHSSRNCHAVVICKHTRSLVTSFRSCSRIQNSWNDLQTSLQVINTLNVQLTTHDFLLGFNTSLSCVV